MSKADQTRLPVVIFDCFTNERFGGNIGGLVLEAGDLDTGQMQGIAGEINAPVTGFVTEISGNEVSVRFFMPAAEIAMCGHVTIGLFTYLVRKHEGVSDFSHQFTMKASAGDIEVSVTRSNGGLPRVMMELSLPRIVSSAIDHQALADALGVDATAFSNAAPIEGGDAGLKHLFVPFSSLQTVQTLSPDFVKLDAVSRAHSVQTIACFTMETTDPGNTLHIRDFCPALGANEVPASGTTNGALAGYLARHGFVKPASLGDPVTVRAEQGTELGRSSLITTEFSLAGETLTRLQVGGEAVASIEGIVHL